MNKKMYVACSVMLLASGAFAGKSPNIVIFFADDLGWADVGYHRVYQEVQTPHIDRIAASGAQFTDGYVTSSICAPSRAALMTGRYQQRWGYDDIPGAIRRDPAVFPGIPPSEKQLAEYLKPLGYRTAFIGKHHDGHASWCNPYVRGFDYFHGYFNTGHGYFLEDNFTHHRTSGEHYKIDGLFWENDQWLTEPPKGYITDRYGEMACAWLKEGAGSQPFFLYLPFSAVHGHVEAKEEHIAKFTKLLNEAGYGDPDEPRHDARIRKRAELLGCLYAMDEAIGSIMKTIEEMGALENTIVIFSSDNGGDPERYDSHRNSWEGNSSRNTPFRGGKNSMFEGGNRVPFCVSWPGRIKAGQTFSQPVSTLDVVPTLLAAIKRPPKKDDPAFDGINLLPLLTGETTEAPHETLYWRLSPGWAIRDGDWKLVRPKTSERLLLFNLAEDKVEANDLSEKHPERVELLKRKYEAWNGQMLPAMWGRARSGIHGDYELEDYKPVFTVPDDKRTDLSFKKFR